MRFFGKREKPRISGTPKSLHIRSGGRWHRYDLVQDQKPILIDEAPPLLSAELAADLADTPSLPDAVRAYLAAVDESDALGHAPADLMEAALIKEDEALADLRTAYAQVIPS